MAAVVVRAWRGWWRFIHVAWEVHADAVAELTDGLRGWSLGTILFGLTLAGLTATPEIVLEIGAALLMVYGMFLVRIVRDRRRRASAGGCDERDA